MSSNQSKAVGFLSVVLCFVPLVAWAQPIDVGDPIARFAISDQYDESQVVDEHVRLILFSADMKGGRLVARALAGMPRDYLARNAAVYIADVSGMPKFITEHFALPKMKTYAFRIGLARNRSATPAFPSRPAKITLLYLKELKVQSIEYAEDPQTITTAIEQLAANHRSGQALPHAARAAPAGGQSPGGRS